MIVKPCVCLLNMTIGYLIMFVLMTYNIGLFFALVFGNLSGYCLFSVFLNDFIIENDGIQYLKIDNQHQQEQHSDERSTSGRDTTNLIRRSRKFNVTEE
jgi:hypothetical protein